MSFIVPIGPSPTGPLGTHRRQIPQFISQGPSNVINNTDVVGIVDSDPFFANVVALLHCDGINGSITVTDSSLLAANFTGSGGTISTTQAKFGGSSLSVAGASQVGASAASSNFAFGTGDFTIEFLVYATSFSGAVQIVYDQRPAGVSGLYPTIYLFTAGEPIYLTNSANQITGTALSTSTWHHIALSRVSGNTRMFIDGTQTGSTYVDSNNYLNSSGRPVLGNSNAAGSDFTGFIDEVRITKGVGRYSANFTVPTEAFRGQGLSFTQDWVRAQTDPVGVVDSVAGLDAGRTFTDAVGIVDSFTIQNDRSITDPVGVTDTFATQDAYDRSISDPVGIVDGFATQDAYDRSITDPIGIADSSTIQQDLLRSQTDALGITDSAATTQDLVRTPTDPVGVVDSFATQDAYDRQIIDPVGILDTAVFLDSMIVAGTDPVGIIDSAFTQQNWVRTQIDPVGVTDSAVFNRSANNVSAIDPINVVDLAFFIIFNTPPGRTSSADASTRVDYAQAVTQHSSADARAATTAGLAGASSSSANAATVEVGAP